MKRPIDPNNPHHPFSIPEGYFDDMKRQVIEKTISRKENPGHIESPFFVRIIRSNWLPIAASLIIMFTIAFAIWQYTSPKEGIFAGQTELFYPESTDDLLAFVIDDPSGSISENEATLEDFEDFLLSLESLDE